VSAFAWLGERISYPWPETGEDPLKVGPKLWKLAQAGAAVMGDTFPITWADDGEMYTSSGDPYWGGKEGGLDVETFVGDAPRYDIRRVSAMPGYDGNAGEGPKPSGMICAGGVLYLAFQNLLGKKPPAHGEASQHGSDAVVVSSKDHGATWTPPIRDLKAPFFPGCEFGGPAFVNFGRDNEGARDGFVYAVSADQWDNGSHLRLGRVPRDRITDPAAWEWAGAGGEGGPRWTARLAEAVPVLSRDRHISLPEMVCVGRRRYLLLTWRLNRDYTFDAGSRLMIYRASEPWGPFTLLHEEEWESAEVTPYCPRLPLKWLRRTDDGVDGWLQFSGRPGSHYYRSHVRRFRLRLA